MLFQINLLIFKIFFRILELEEEEEETESNIITAEPVDAGEPGIPDESSVSTIPVQRSVQQVGR